MKNDGRGLALGAVGLLALAGLAGRRGGANRRPSAAQLATAKQQWRGHQQALADWWEQGEIAQEPESASRLENRLIRALFGVHNVGENADWIDPAFHLGPSEKANVTSGDVYLLNEEDGGWTVLRLWFVGDGNRRLPEGMEAGPRYVWRQGRPVPISERDAVVSDPQRHGLVLAATGEPIDWFEERDTDELARFEEDQFPQLLDYLGENIARFRGGRRSIRGTRAISIEEKGTRIVERVASIRAKHAEQKALLARLQRMGRLMAAGVDPAEIDTFRIQGRKAVLRMKDGRRREVPAELFKGTR